ncbi:MAG: alpha/beta fold hydrolase [Candidatus Alcyoniella australis]|nr:alpha/beta fold hydrolase [Candidatus Alcyoniella australis]
MRSPTAALLAVLIFVLLCCALTACDSNDDDDDQDPQDDDDSGNDDDGDDDGQPECDDTLLPIVFAHGLIENGDAFHTQTQRLTTNGYCPEQIHSFDWNTLGDVKYETLRLEGFVAEVMQRSGAQQIDLLGHSMGGYLCHEFLSRPGNPALVAHYANLAALPYQDFPALVDTLNISSPDDYIIGGVTQIEGAQNVVLPGLDHLQLATSAQTFDEIYRFFNDREPRTTQIEPHSPIRLAGRVLTLGENLPKAGIELRVYQVDPANAMRYSEQPLAVFQVDDNGYWGELIAEPEAYYEFVYIDPDPELPPVHYYREPFVRSSDKVHFRSFPGPESFLGYVFRLIPFDDELALVAYLNLNRSLVAGRDTLLVNGLDLAATPIGDPQASTIVVGFIDSNFNGVSDLTMAGFPFDMVPFIRVFDMRVAGDQQAATNFEFSGRPLAVRNWPSRSEGISIAFFN